MIRLRYQNVCMEGWAYRLPPEVVTSAEIEQQLQPVYERLLLPEGRLELMTGIAARRFFPRGTLPGQISTETVNQLLGETGFDRNQVGALIHGSVSRDQLEPATACRVHDGAQLPSTCCVLDISNACVGLLNGVITAANMIEMGQVRAAVIVGTESSRELVESTIQTLLNSPDLSRKQMKLAFASLTIGSGAAAILLCHRELSRTGNHLLGGTVRTESSHHGLCAGGESVPTAHDNPLMQTDAGQLLHAGVELATRTWAETREILGWTNEGVQKAFTHQVGKVHKKLLYERLGLNPEIDFSTVEYLGNTGAVALPITVALGLEQGHLHPGDRVGLLGIGSGLNCLMLGWEYHGR